VHAGRRQHEIVAELARRAPAFSMVRGIANMAKHVVLTSTTMPVRPRIEDTHVGPEEMRVVDADGDPVPVLDTDGAPVRVVGAGRAVMTVERAGRVRARGRAGAP
jgi:hypothetical protein